MTASISIVKLEVETSQAALSSWLVVAPCLTVKPLPDWALVTEPSVSIKIKITVVIESDFFDKFLSKQVHTMYDCYMYGHDPECKAFSNCSMYLMEIIDTFPASAYAVLSTFSQMLFKQDH